MSTRRQQFVVVAASACGRRFRCAPCRVCTIVLQPCRVCVFCGTTCCPRAAAHGAAQARRRRRRGRALPAPRGAGGPGCARHAGHGAGRTTKSDPRDDGRAEEGYSGCRGQIQGHHCGGACWRGHPRARARPRARAPPAHRAARTSWWGDQISRCVCAIRSARWTRTGSASRPRSRRRSQSRFSA